MAYLESASWMSDEIRGQSTLSVAHHFQLLIWYGNQLMRKD